MSETKRKTTPPVRDFWAAAQEGAKSVQAGPAWMRAGIRLNEANFTTYGPERLTATPEKK